MNAIAMMEEPNIANRNVAGVPKVLLVGPSLRIMGGQAVMADRIVRAMKADGVQIDFLPINPRPPKFLHFAEKIAGVRTLVVSFFYVISLVRTVPKYDLIHLFSASYLSFIISQMPAILIAKAFGKPLILNYRSGEAEDHLRTWGRSINWLLRMVTQIVTPSEYLVHVFGKFGFKAGHVFNVIDPQAINYRMRTKAEPKIVVPRTLEPDYNVACAIRAFRLIQEKYPDASLTILGDGSQRAELEKLVEDLQVKHVCFTGRVERSDVGRMYDESDILVNTTSVDNMPVSLLEGFAAGIPIVTTDAGGIPYIVKDGENGYLVPVDDHEAVAERVLFLLETPAEVERLSRHYSEEVKKYLWDSVAENWYKLYRDVAKSGG